MNNNSGIIINKFKKRPELLILYIFLALIVIIPSFFVQGYGKFCNLLNILRLSSILGIVALGQTIVVLIGGIDLSLGAVVTFINIVAAGMIANQPERVVPVVLICLLLGILIGLINSIVVIKFNVPPLIATIGMMTVLEGVTYIYTGGFPRGGIPEFFRFIGTGSIFNIIPVSVVIWLVLTLGVYILTRKTVFGRRIFAIGVNEKNAFASGVKVKKVKIICFIISGFMGALAGLVLAAYMGTPTICFGFGMDYTLGSVVAVVLGGTILAGGRGGVIGTLGGVLIFRFMLSLLTMLNVSKPGQNIIEGIILIGMTAVYAKKFVIRNN